MSKSIADAVSMLSIIMGGASIALAVVAIYFTHAFYRDGTKTQADAQALLAKVSEKLDVVSERTSGQMDKAFDSILGALPWSLERTPGGEEGFERKTTAEFAAAAETLGKNAGLGDKDAQALGESMAAHAEALTMRLGIVHLYGALTSALFVTAQRLGQQPDGLASLASVWQPIRERLGMRIPPSIVSDAEFLAGAQAKVMQGGHVLSSEEMDSMVQAAKRVADHFSANYSRLMSEK